MTNKRRIGNYGDIWKINQNTVEKTFKSLNDKQIENSYRNN